jgi:hypothetical protein
MTTSGSVVSRIISTDDHVIEPPDVWLARLPRRYHDVAPRKARAPLGEAVLRDGKVAITVGTDGPESD